MAPSLRDRVIVVTGATGIAAATARRVAEDGASVFTISIDEHECKALHDGLDDASRHGWAAADLTDETATQAAFARAVETLGPIDGLVAVAGGSGRRFGDGPLHEIGLDAWNATLALNLTTSFLSMRETIRSLETAGRGGSVVVVSSVLADHPSPALFSTHAYAAAKGAQLALVTATAAAYAERGIRINAIAPAVVATPMSLRAQGDERVRDYVEHKQPLAGGFLEAESVAEAAAFLLSDAASMVTGQVLAVDGGWSVTEPMR